MWENYLPHNPNFFTKGNDIFGGIFSSIIEPGDLYVPLSEEVDIWSTHI